MKAGTVMRKTRMYMKDMNKTSLSDWEIYEVMNDALQIFAEVNSSTKGPLFREKASLSFTDNRAPLPARYIDMERVFDALGKEMFQVFHANPMAGEFRLSGLTIFSANPAATIWYFSYPEPILNEVSDIDLPENALVPISKATAALLRGDIGEATTYAEAFITGKVPKTGGAPVAEDA